MRKAGDTEVEMLTWVHIVDNGQTLMNVPFIHLQHRLLTILTQELLTRIHTKWWVFAYHRKYMDSHKITKGQSVKGRNSKKQDSARVLEVKVTLEITLHKLFITKWVQDRKIDKTAQPVIFPWYHCIKKALTNWDKIPPYFWPLPWFF